MAMSHGFFNLAPVSAPTQTTRNITYSLVSAQVIRLEFGQSVAVKKLSKIEKTASKLSQWVN